jgi:hypothetical protein
MANLHTREVPELSEAETAELQRWLRRSTTQDWSALIILACAARL